MKLSACVLALMVGVSCLRAQDTNQVAQLQQQLRQMQENFERIQRDQSAQIAALAEKLKALTEQQSAETEKKSLEAKLAAGMAATPANSPPPEKAAWSPASPITVARTGSAYMNMSFDAMMAAGGSTVSDPSSQLQLGDHDPIKNGLSLRNAEIALDGAVDPYFKGFANIVLKLDKNNQTDIELEEAYAQSTSLPANLQVKAGQFFSAFGRQNAQHPHQWAFVDTPIIFTRAFGPDGLRNIGAQGSWLLPLPIYTELFLGAFDGQGSTMFGFRYPGDPDMHGVNRFHGRETLNNGLRGPQDLVWTPRLASSFELTDQQTLVLGTSAAFGPNDTGANARTQIFGLDLYWKWKAADAHEGFPFVSWQTEGLYECFDAGADPGAALPAELLHDWGAYSQVLWGFKPRWVTGLRGEYANGNRGAYGAADVYRGERTRVSPVLTFYPSEFSKIRLQYNYDHGELFGNAHSVWLQLEFLLGAHGAHKF
ncbi:MAG: hypothetical protein WCS94_01575 [Verrucomicrobiota bacterium]